MDGITVKGLPLTGAQRNVWFHQQLDPNEPAYNTGNYIELEGDICLLYTSDAADE